MALVAVLGVVFYNEVNMINQDHATVIQITNFLNQQIQASQKAQQATK